MKRTNRRATFVTLLASTAAATLLGAAVSRRDVVQLSSLDLTNVRQDFGQPHADKSVDGRPLSIATRKFEHGIGTHAGGVICLDLGGRATRFSAMAGVDDEELGKPASVRLRVIADGKTLFRSGVVTPGQEPQKIDLDVTGVKLLMLVADDAGDGNTFDHVDWADAAVEITGAAPAVVAPPAPGASGGAQILTPPPSPKPRINSARVFGVRPGHPVLYTIAATGQKPITFAADGLPPGVSLDPNTGQITGGVKEAGEYAVVLRASNSLGAAERKLRLVVGPRVALTPPMGWNHWNCFGLEISDAKVRAAADAMVASGLADHGWTNINIDDAWMVKPGSDDPLLGGPARAADGRILSNKRFPDMKGLSDYVHAKGLRLGIYSSPGPTTCGGFNASYRHEEDDAKQFAEWGIDYLKYDWCSYETVAHDNDVAGFQKPYRVMRAALAHADRDIVYSLCQYGMGNVWEWGAQVDGNCWRTTGDINDTWGIMTGIGFNQAGHEKYAGPGHWNDPDMLVVGYVGWGRDQHPTRLTPDEQYTHLSLWSLLSAPLLIGCDLTRLDPFTLNLLTNDEVIDVDQDPLGKQASRVWSDGELEVWSKDLEDGSKAVGLFNRGEDPQTVSARWEDLKLSGKQTVRDLWRQRDVGEFAGKYDVEVAPHGAVLVKIGSRSKQ